MHACAVEGVHDAWVGLRTGDLVMRCTPCCPRSRTKCGPGRATGATPGETEHVTADEDTAASCNRSVPPSDGRVPVPDEGPPVPGDVAPAPVRILQLPLMALRLLAMACPLPKGYPRAAVVCP